MTRYSGPGSYGGCAPYQEGCLDSLIIFVFLTASITHVIANSVNNKKYDRIKQNTEKVVSSNQNVTGSDTLCLNTVVMSQRTK